MVISGRQACALLAEAGVARTQGRRVLLAGLAGEAVQTSSALLYDEARVRDLAAWPELTSAEVLRACPHGLFVARVPGRQVPDAVREGWPLSVPIRVVLRLRAAEGRPLPLIATVSGFVATGAEVVGVTPEQREARTSRLELAPPGAWFEQLRRRRFDTGPGKSWLIWPNQSWVVADRAPAGTVARAEGQRGTSAQ